MHKLLHVPQVRPTRLYADQIWTLAGHPAHHRPEATVWTRWTVQASRPVAIRTLETWGRPNKTLAHDQASPLIFTGPECVYAPGEPLSRDLDARSALGCESGTPFASPRTMKQERRGCIRPAQASTPPTDRRSRTNVMATHSREPEQRT